jgi:hypothetical protein
MLATAPDRWPVLVRTGDERQWSGCDECMFGDGVLPQLSQDKQFPPKLYGEGADHDPS